MQQPLLSICIPTYNRAKYLPECLDSIVSQFKDKEIYEKTEIVIADNASSDNTEEIVKQYQNNYSNIHYFKNEKNLGFDRSFVKLITKSNGKYCLSLGDDDALFENTLSFLIATIEKSTVPFYGLNCWGYDFHLREKVLNHPNLTITKDHHYTTLNHYIHSIREYTNLVGIFVGLSTQLFLREPWVAFQGKEQYFDTLAIHMYVNLSIFKDSPFILLVKPIVKTRSSNIRWDVFAGLETIKGRITSTIEIATWIRNTFKLPISDTKLYLYFTTREYWFTGKEIIKRKLMQLGLGEVIRLYRKLR